MNKRRIVKDDGRYLIYYTFPPVDNVSQRPAADNAPAGNAPDTAPADSAPADNVHRRSARAHEAGPSQFSESTDDV